MDPNNTLDQMALLNKAQSPYDRPQPQGDLNGQMMASDQQGMAQAGGQAQQTGADISSLLGSGSGGSGGGSGSSLSGLASIISLFL